MSSSSTTAEDDAVEAYRYLRWNVLASRVDQRLAQPEAQATLAVYEELWGHDC